MYKIYINNSLIDLAPKSQWLEQKPEPEILATEYFGKRNALLNYIDAAEKSKTPRSFLLYGEDHEALINDFFSLYKIVEAAGGLVFNKEEKILAIFRRGFWDLPKGKIDPGETPDQAAIREVQEETGLTNVSKKELLHTSFHTYRNKKDKRCLKPTFWFKMTTTDTKLTPQAEEDIEQAVWLTIEEFLKGDYNTYGSIKDVLEAGLE